MKTRRDSGQILIEYVLLLMIGVTIGNILVKQLTAFSDDPDKRGVIINRWIQIWESIGKDTPDN
jgi:hypothetical protein